MLLRIHSYEPGKTYKKVWFHSVCDETPDKKLIKHALKIAGESKDSSFGWDLNRYSDGMAVVTIYTD